MFVTADISPENYVGNDLQYNLNITLDESIFGCTKEIKFSKKSKCNTCNGTSLAKDSKLITCSVCDGTGVVKQRQSWINIAKPCKRCYNTGKIPENECKTCKGSGRIDEIKTLQIKIPPGINTGMRLCSSGNGNVGIRQVGSGDLYVFIFVNNKHDLFTRVNYDLVCDIPISVTLAILGGELNVPTPYGTRIIKIPKGTQHNTVFRMKNLGVTHIDSDSRGDMHIRVHIEIPVNLSVDTKSKTNELLNILSDDLHYPTHKQYKNIMNTWLENNIDKQPFKSKQVKNEKN